MAYSHSLAERVRQLIGGHKGLAEKKMFGGLGFLLRGNMCLGIWHDALIARIGPEAYELALQEDYVREFDVTGRPMKGWVLIEPDGLETNEQLSVWVRRSLDFVRTLPAK